MTKITISDCIAAIKQSKEINPFLSFMDDWKQVRRFKSKGVWVRECYTASMEETVFVSEQPSGLVVSVVKPDIQWAFKVLPQNEWSSKDDVTFWVYDKDLMDELGSMPIDDVSHLIDKLPMGSISIADTAFVNPNYTEINFRDMMERLDFIDETPEYEETFYLEPSEEPSEEPSDDNSNPTPSDKLKDWLFNNSPYSKDDDDN